MMLHTTETFVPDQLIAGNADLLQADAITLAAGQNLPRGAVLGKVTATGHYVLSAADDGADPPVAITDGSQTPDLILVEDTDASLQDTPALGYRRGDFQAAHITIGSGHTLSSVAEGLRVKGITLV